jgi:hypothetical protein
VLQSCDEGDRIADKKRRPSSATSYTRRSRGRGRETPRILADARRDQSKSSTDPHYCTRIESQGMSDLPVAVNLRPIVHVERRYGSSGACTHPTEIVAGLWLNQPPELTQELI